MSDSRTYNKFKIFYSCFFLGVGGLLVIAGFLKLDHAVEAGIDKSPMTFVGKMVGIYFEISLGVTFVCNAFWHSRTIEIFAVIAFFIFGVYQLWLVKLGVDECGCFGRFSFSPRLMSFFDLAIATVSIALLRTRFRMNDGNFNSGCQFRSIQHRCQLFGIGLAATIVVLKISTMSLPIPVHGLDKFPAELIKIRPVIRIDDQMVGSTFDFERILGAEYSKDLEKGKWIIGFVSQDCKKCLAAILKLENQILEENRVQFGRSLLISVYATETQLSSLFSKQVSINHEYRWVVETPFFVEVNDSVVVSVMAI